ncbi:hypothetical protein AYL99_11702 [Fonsecaea erecta]|uniref:Uncharacterized protein n=1 Tax=Fonsecaea erecta TaxID=1367422 RepID=A0A178Z363_9EURO|nr:hypothetical protein AYL99_11702 [Fonsecaea erecta]OAP54167.1 hypothetical protein AYL99_11702 [Fonsecaea erecta]
MAAFLVPQQAIPRTAPRITSKAIFRMQDHLQDHSEGHFHHYHQDCLQADVKDPVQLQVQQDLQAHRTLGENSCANLTSSSEVLQNPGLKSRPTIPIAGRQHLIVILVQIVKASREELNDGVLTDMSVQPVTMAEAAFMSAVIDTPGYLQNARLSVTLGLGAWAWYRGP